MKKKIAIALDSEILSEIDILSKKERASRSQEIENLIRLGMKNRQITTAVIMLHKTEKNCLFENDNYLLNKHIEFISKNSIINVIFLSNFTKEEQEKIINKFEDISIKFIEDEFNGTAIALKKIKRYLYSDFILINGDTHNDFNLKNMIDFHKENKGIITIGLIHSNSPEKFGSVLIDGNRIVKFNEKTEPLSNVINAGIYIANPEIFDYIKEKKSFEREVLPNLVEEKRVLGYFTLGKYSHYGN